jgi:hypothetical protein
VPTTGFVLLGLITVLALALDITLLLLWWRDHASPREPRRARTKQPNSR